MRTITKATGQSFWFKGRGSLVEKRLLRMSIVL